MAKIFSIIVILSVTLVLVQGVDEVKENEIVPAAPPSSETVESTVSDAAVDGGDASVKEEGSIVDPSELTRGNRNVTVEGSVHGSLSKSKKRIRMLFRNFMVAVRTLIRKLQFKPPSPPSSNQPEPAEK